MCPPCSMSGQNMASLCCIVIEKMTSNKVSRPWKWPQTKSVDHENEYVYQMINHE